MKRLLLAALVLSVNLCRQTIQHGLYEAQANEIETLLHSAGITARKAREGGRDARYSVEVPDESASAALKLLNDHGLPRERPPGFGEVFGKGSMVPTAIEENALFLHALSGELGRTLAGVEGVVSARVHVVAPPSAPLSALRAPTRARASVLLKVRHGELDAVHQRRLEIQALVAGSVEGLDAQQVSVMLSELPVPPVVTPVVTAHSSAQWPLAIAAAIVAALSGTLAFLFLRLRRLQQGAPAPEGTAITAP
ncbi:MAG: hypothetical protein HY901_29605 [Deltaproteobacteria bacterium]|nr:hypothetical protein [Deltaproteobacteria bacterium]